MAFDIGAGTLILIGTATAPNNAAHGGTAADADLTSISPNLKSFSITNAQGTQDITTLAVANYSKAFITSLIDSKVSGAYIDDPTGSLFRRLKLLRLQTVSAVSRGMFDVIVKVGGAVTGNLRLDFTMCLTELPFDIGVETELGGTFSGQITGAVTPSTQ